MTKTELEGVYLRVFAALNEEFWQRGWLPPALPQTSKEPIGYGYSHEIQSGLGSYFIVVRERHDRYDTPIYADTRSDRASPHGEGR